MSTEVSPDWHQIHFRDATVVDLHAHPSLKVSLFNRPLDRRFKTSRSFDPFSLRTDFPSLKKGGLKVLLSVVYAPEKDLLKVCRLLRLMGILMPRKFRQVFKRPYLDVALDMLNVMEDTVKGSQAARMATSVTDLEEILKLKEDRPIAVIHCIEGAHCLDGKLENLDLLYDRGVAYITLAHFFENEVVHPCFPWPEAIQVLGCFQDQRDLTLGLKPFGEQVVERMVELGMLIDVSHCTPPARARIYDIVANRAPLLATHVGAYAVNPSPYNLKDWEIRRIAESGGVTGVIFMNYWLMPHATGRGLNFITRTIDHFIQVGGVDHVSLGTDFDGFTDPPDDLKDASELPRLTQRLVAEGYPQGTIVKILGGNALRVIREGWGRQD